MTLRRNTMAQRRTLFMGLGMPLLLCAAQPAFADLAAMEDASLESIDVVSPTNLDGNFEQPEVLNAADLLPAYLLSSPLFSVDPAVRNDGKTNHYSVQSLDGPLEAEGRDGLVRVIQEIRALDLLRDSRKRDGMAVGFNQGMKRIATAPYRSVKRVVFDPLYAVEAVPSEIADYAGKLATVGDLFHYGPYVFVRKSLGIDGARKNLAKRLQVDSNTDNKALESEIKRVGWGVWMGGALPGLGDDYVDLQIDLSKEVGDLGEGNLGRAVDAIRREVFPRSARRMFKKMHIPTALSKSIRTNIHYTNKMREQFATALMTMDKTQGRAEFVAWADTVENALEAQQVVRLAQVMAVWNALEKPITAIHGRDDALAVQVKDGSVIAPLRFDYLLWTEFAAQYVARVEAFKETFAPGATLEWWSSGETSPRFREQVIARGDTLRVNVDDDFPSFERPHKGLERLEQKYERQIENPVKNGIQEHAPTRKHPRLHLDPLGPNQAPQSNPSGLAGAGAGITSNAALAQRR